MVANPSEPRCESDTGRARADAGFTLLEVVIAAAIAALALIGLFRSGSTGMFVVSQAARIEEAIERANSHLATFGRSLPIVAGNLEGEDGGGYYWRLSAVPTAVQRAAGDEDATTAVTLYDVKVTISWRTWVGERSVVLETRRFASATSSPGG